MDVCSSLIVIENLWGVITKDNTLMTDDNAAAARRADASLGESAAPGRDHHLLGDVVSQPTSPKFDWRMSRAALSN